MEEKFLTTKQAAAFLKISVPTIFRYLGDGKIPSYKIGKKRVFDREELVDWVKTGKSDPRFNYTLK